MEFTESERDLVLRALFELMITHPADADVRAATKTLAEKLGGRPDAVLFGAYLNGDTQH